MLGHALADGTRLDPGRVLVVVRHERDLVAAHVTDVDPLALLADQDEIPGTAARSRSR
jgi:bifunctional UDP-N-acetylglucosamine pyrophosphorylase/glucosamine-1-phosphate N-acetyltransferase